MSSVLVESTSSTSQLYLPFVQCEDISQNDDIGERQQFLEQEPTEQSEASDRNTEDNAAPKPNSMVVQIAEDDSQRIAEPVRIGTVMVRLLKRYGITDAEISAGVNEYADKNAPTIQPEMAS